MTSADEIRAYILTFVGEPRDVPDNFDLRMDGAIDSIRFMKLIADLEVQMGATIDLSDIDPARLTNLGVLSRHIAANLTGPDDASR